MASMQVPFPSHRPAVVSIPLLQPGCWQIVPAEYFWQAPAPSHCPVSPQLDAPSSVQAPRGLVPTSAARQVPTCPAAEQV